MIKGRKAGVLVSVIHQGQLQINILIMRKRNTEAYKSCIRRRRETLTDLDKLIKYDGQ